MPAVSRVRAALEQSGHTLFEDGGSVDHDVPSRKLAPQPVGPFARKTAEVTGNPARVPFEAPESHRLPPQAGAPDRRDFPHAGEAAEGEDGGGEDGLVLRSLAGLGHDLQNMGACVRAVSRGSHRRTGEAPEAFPS